MPKPLAKYWVSYTKADKVPENLRGTIIYKGNNKADALKAQKAAKARYGWEAVDSFQARF